MKQEKERRKRILELLREGEKTPKELASYFGVSLMTIYRDIKELEREGLIEKEHGILRLKEQKEELPKECFVCHKEIDGRFNAIFFLKDGKKAQACCPHCGLMGFKILGDKIEAVLMKDFISCNPINASSCWYVVGASISPCCTPSAFAFVDKETAEKFAKGFGGSVLPLKEAVEEIYRLMSIGTPVKFNL